MNSNLNNKWIAPPTSFQKIIPRLLVGIFFLLAFLFPQIVYAEKKSAKVARFEKKKDSHKTFANISAKTFPKKNEAVRSNAKKTDIAKSHKKKIGPTKPITKKAELAKVHSKKPEQVHPQPKPQIVNIERVFESNEYVIKVRARQFKQGELMFVRLQANGSGKDLSQLQKYNLYWMKKKVEMFVLGNDYMGFIPIHPELAPGTYDLEVKTDEQSETYKVCPILIEKNQFVKFKDRCHTLFGCQSDG